jgi:hypothetical protein
MHVIRAPRIETSSGTSGHLAADSANGAAGKAGAIAGDVELERSYRVSRRADEQGLCPGTKPLSGPVAAGARSVG